MKNQNRAILWALDPFELEVRPDPKAVAQLVTWAKARGFDIQPVFVLSRPSLDLAKYAGDSLSNFVMASMRNKVNVYLSSLGVDHAKPCEVILAHSTAREEAIQEILRLAESYCSPWVIVSSHGRSGLSRLAFGSFAEALVMQSKFPILFLPRTHHDNAQMNRLLFPTDFSSASHAAFRRLLEEARSAQMKITLYYSNVWPALSFAAMDVPAALPTGFLEEEEKKARSEAGRWILEAKERNVEVEFKCSNDGSCFNVGRSILEAANTLDAGMISISCGSRSIASFIEGSIARDVFRTNEFPVLVYGPLSTTS